MGCCTQANAKKPKSLRPIQDFEYNHDQLAKLCEEYEQKYQEITGEDLSGALSIPGERPYKLQEYLE